MYVGHYNTSYNAKYTSYYDKKIEEPKKIKF